MEEKKHICKYCGQEFEEGRQLGSHYLTCKKNPKYDELNKKRSSGRTKNAGVKERTLICEVCGSSYTIVVSDRQLETGKYKRCCSRLCSNRLTLKNSDIKKLREKQSISLIGKNIKHPYKKLKILTCTCCGKDYTYKDYKSSIYCSRECSDKTKHIKLSELAKCNNFGGLNPETTHTNYKRGYYKGIWCDSSWELAYVIYCLEHNISIERNKDYIEYTFENEICKFYPDFIVDGKLVEIKGFYTPKNKAKLEQVDNVEFIDRTKIQPYLKYVIDKYGRYFYNNLYDNIG